jgi:hypothetical protein
MPTPVENFSTGVFPFCDLIGWTKLKGVRRCRLERRLSGVGCWQCEVMGRQVDRRGMALHLASAKNKVEAEKPNPMRPALSFHADRYRANDPDRKFTMSAVWVIYGHAFWHKRFGASIVWR